MWHDTDTTLAPPSVIDTARARRRIAVEKMHLREAMRELRLARAANKPPPKVSAFTLSESNA